MEVTPYRHNYVRIADDRGNAIVVLLADVPAMAREAMDVFDKSGAVER